MTESEYAEQNVKIAEIVGWIKAGDCWHRPNGEVWSHPPDFFSSEIHAAEFRQHTMQQGWCNQISLSFSKDREQFEATCQLFIDGAMPDCFQRAESEASASSLACLAAWEAMEGKLPAAGRPA